MRLYIHLLWDMKFQGIPFTMQTEWGGFLSRLLASIDDLNTPRWIMMFTDPLVSQEMMSEMIIWICARAWCRCEKKKILAFSKQGCWTVDKFRLWCGGGTNRERKERNSTAVDFQNCVFDFPDGPLGAYMSCYARGLVWNMKDMTWTAGWPENDLKLSNNKDFCCYSMCKILVFNSFLKLSSITWWVWNG